MVSSWSHGPVAGQGTQTFCCAGLYSLGQLSTASSTPSRSASRTLTPSKAAPSEKVTSNGAVRSRCSAVTLITTLSPGKTVSQPERLKVKGPVNPPKIVAVSE